MNSMKREFKTDFLRTLGELIEGCIERDTNTVELHFETSGIRWSVQMIFKLDEGGECDEHD